MIRFRLIALTVVGWTTVLSATYAEHSGRPANVPKPEGLRIFYFNSDGEVVGAEGSSNSFLAKVFGWSFDSKDPNSPFEASSFTFEQSDPDGAIAEGDLYLAYNECVLKFSNLNNKALEMSPTFNFGPTYFNTFDNSRLEVTNSVIKSVFADDHSNVQLANTFLDGSVGMNSDQTMQLSAVKPFGKNSDIQVTAHKGTTTIDANSVITQVHALGSAIVAVTDSTVDENVFTSDDNTAANPKITLTNTNVGKLRADLGTIAMTGGQVDGVVEAIGTGTIEISGSVLKFSPSARGQGTLSLTGTTVNDLSAGDSLEKPATINVTGGIIKGKVEAIGGGVVNITGVNSIGNTQGIALQSHDFGKVTLSEVPLVLGDVLADGDSSMNLGSLKEIVGDLFVGGKAILDVNGVDVGGVVLASENATIHMTGGSAFFASAGGVSTVNLNGVAVSEFITTTGHGRLTFGPGSRAGKDIINIGGENGLISVLGGDVAGNLVGFGNSITSMSGGHVVGFPVFHQQATFLYSGGKFDLFGTPQPEPPESLPSLASGTGGDEGDPANLQLAGFTILDDAEIQFIGFGLQSTLVDPNFIDDDSLSYSVYQLTGRLADGSTIDGGLVYVQNLTNARFQLIEAPVPEPSSAALFIGMTIVFQFLTRRPQLLAG